MLRIFILNDASAERVADWLEAWGHRNDLCIGETPVGEPGFGKMGEAHIHCPLGGNWAVEFQVLPLSANRCELHIWYSESENTNQKAAEYLAGIAAEIAKRWQVDETSIPGDIEHPLVAEAHWHRKQNDQRSGVASLNEQQRAILDDITKGMPHSVIALRHDRSVKTIHNKAGELRRRLGTDVVPYRKRPPEKIG